MDPPYIECNMVCISRSKRKQIHEAGSMWNGTVPLQIEVGTSVFF